MYTGPNPIIIRMRIINEPCRACGAQIGERCTFESAPEYITDWTHAR